MIPKHVIILELPEPLSPDASEHAQITRLHNRIVKEAMKRTLLNHWKVRIPTHFKLRAKTRYRHYKRSPRTIQVKQRRGFTIPDLVKSGRTRRKMRGETPRIRLGGSAFQGEIRGVMTLRFPPGFKDRAGANRGITRQHMADEISRWTSEEEREASKYFVDEYMKLLKAEMAKRPTVRKRYAQKLSTLGITF